MANHNLKNKKGWIELITGCMFAGKTEEFIRRIRTFTYAQFNVLVFKPEIDNRYSDEKIVSHAGASIDAITISTSKEIDDKVKSIKEKVDVVAIDEVQFIDEGIVKVACDMADRGIIVVVNGLDTDFKADPFQNVDKFLVQAEYVKKLSAICRVCGGNANRTQRIVNGQPARKDEPIILVSGNDHYEARCRHCYIKPE
jgi:thymidine kinase